MWFLVCGFLGCYRWHATFRFVWSSFGRLWLRLRLSTPSCTRAILGSIWQSSHSSFQAKSRRSSTKLFFYWEVIICWFCVVILWNKLRGWELKKIASPDSMKWFSIVIYVKESKRITFSHKITSLRESASINNQNQIELYQTGPSGSLASLLL